MMLRRRNHGCGLFLHLQLVASLLIRSRPRFHAGFATAPFPAFRLRCAPRVCTGTPIALAASLQSLAPVPCATFVALLRQFGGYGTSQNHALRRLPKATCEISE
jgi:hypothetical protein